MNGMTDFDAWRKHSKETWDSRLKETAIARYLEEASGTKIEPVGLGAGNADFLSGSASEYGHAKGDADLVVVGTHTSK